MVAHVFEVSYHSYSRIKKKGKWKCFCRLSCCGLNYIRLHHDPMKSRLFMQLLLIFISLFIINPQLCLPAILINILTTVCLSVFITLFLDASSHLYMNVCPSVRPSVRMSVRNQFRKIALWTHFIARTGLLMNQPR